MTRQLVLGQYPYTYLRTILMKRALLNKQDFDKISKLSAKEISAYLQELEYKKEIDELGVEYSGSDLVERALLLNLGRTFSKLLRISPPDLRALLNTYLRRFDVENAKIIMRAKYNGLSAEDTKASATALGVTTPGLVDQLLAQNTVEDVINALPMLSEQEKKQATDTVSSSGTLSPAENVLDRAYFTMVQTQLRAVRDEGKLFKKMLLHEIDAYLVRMIMQLKSEDVDQNHIKELLMKGSLPQSFYDRLSRMSVEEIKKELHKTPFGSVVDELGDDYSLTDLDQALDKYVVQSSHKLIRQYPMSVDAILGYAFLKQGEVRTLLRLIKAKSLGLSDELIERLVIV